MFRNTMKTTVLLAGLGGLFVLVGQLLGGTGGAALGLVLGLAVVGASYWGSDKLALRSTGAQLVDEREAPELYGIVRELTERAGLPMPRVAIIPSDQPNAFATGRNPQHAVVAATTGLLQALPRDEVRAVMAHELAHVRNRDVLIGSVAAAVATAISFIANIATFGAMFGGSDDEDANPLAILLVAMVAPIAAGLVQMAISRSREFEADRTGAELAGDPGALARALQRIEQLADRRPMPVNPAQASHFIVNPLRGNAASAQRARSLFSTHPPVEERVARLASMQSPLRTA